MQTFTLFFGFAIVAIAMENLTSKFLFVKPSDADAKGLPEVQSRAAGRFTYVLHGSTGKEKVTITDGKDTKEHQLTKEEMSLKAINPKIIIDYTNDECCSPDMNVMFRPGYPIKKISTADNPFPQNYETKWNCSACKDVSPRMDLLSRGNKDDRCWAVRNVTDDFCPRCKILEDGVFCHSGKYTIEFQTKNQCKGVTFGGCKIPPEKINFFRQTDTDVLCGQECKAAANCIFYRYDRETKNCTFMNEQNRAAYCNIYAGPKEKTASECLNVDNQQLCEYQLEEECDYNGKELLSYNPGEVMSPNTCQTNCVHRGSECKSWIFHIKESLCILMRDEKKACTTLAGPKQYTKEDCENIENGN